MCCQNQGSGDVEHGTATQPKQRQMCLLGKRGQDSLRDGSILAQAHTCMFIEMYICAMYILCVPAWL